MFYLTLCDFLVLVSNQLTLLLSQYGDTLTNVVVIQFSEAVQTRHDLAYNMTCTIKQPQDITVTSATLGAGYCLTHSISFSRFQYNFPIFLSNSHNAKQWSGLVTMLLAGLLRR